MSKNDGNTSDGGRPYDLEERTAQFGEAIISFLKKVPKNDITSPLIRQVVRSATSIGANYVEADEAGSKKEFRYRISVSKREAKETMMWLRMIATAAVEMAPQSRELWKEAKELNKIFAAIHRNSSE